MGSAFSRSRKEPIVKLPDETVLIKGLGYSIGKKLSEGEFGIVREASHPSQRFPLVVNVLMATYENDRRRIRSQLGFGKSQPDLDMVSRMIHPNIVKIFQIIRTSERLFLFIEKVEHGDVFEYIRLNEKIDINLGKHITFGLANAVAFLHSIGIAHNNVRCDNILLDSLMNARLADFTYASPSVDSSSGDIVYKLPYDGQGSAEYSAPEILRMEEYELMKADVWSIGVCVFMIMTRSVPFDQSRLEILTGIPSRTQHYIADLIAGHVPPECQHLVGNLLEPEVTLRLQVHQIFDDEWFSPTKKPPTTTRSKVKSQTKSTTPQKSDKIIAGDVNGLETH